MTAARARRITRSSAIRTTELLPAVPSRLSCSMGAGLSLSEVLRGPFTRRDHGCIARAIVNDPEVLLLEPKVWLVALAVVPASLLGILVAQRMFLRISRQQLLRAVALVLLATGSSLIVRAAG